MLSEMSDDVAKLKDEISDLNFEISTLQAERDALRKDADSDDSPARFQVSPRGIAMNWIERLEAENKEFGNSEAEARSENMKLLEELGALKATLPILHSKAAYLLRENAQLKAKIEELEWMRKGLEK